MKKKLLIILPVILVLSLVACFIPWPIPYSQTLTATKLDAAGSELDTLQIPIQGIQFNSLFLGDTLKASVGPMEEFPKTDIDSSDFRTSPLSPYLTLTFAVVDTTSDGNLIDAILDDALTTHSYTYHFRISEDLKRWYIHVEMDGNRQAWYVGSLDSGVTTEELLEYFDFSGK